MSNIYILEISQMTDQDWETAKKLTNDSQLYFIPDTNGNVPYTIFETLKALVAPYEFKTLEELGILRGNPYVTMFSMGMFYRNTTGLLCVKASNTGLEPLDGLTVRTLSGELKFNIVSCSSEEYSGSATPVSREKKQAPISEISEEPAYTQTTDSGGNTDAELTNGENTVKLTSEVPLALLSKFQAFDPSGLLSRYAPSVYTVIQENAGEPLMALSYAMHEEIDNEADADAIIDIISREGILTSLLTAIQY